MSSTPSCSSRSGSNGFHYAISLIDREIERVNEELRRIEKLAIRAAEKLGLSCFDGKVYIERQGRRARIKVVDCSGFIKKNRSLGYLESLDVNQFIEYMKRAGLTEDEAKALVSYARLKEVSRILNKAIYHITRAKELLSRDLTIDTDTILKNFIESNKQWLIAKVITR